MDLILFLILAACALFGGHTAPAGVSLAFGPLVAAAAGGVASGLISSAFGGKKKTISQGVLETPEQAAARRALLGYGTTGSIDGFTAGEGYNGPLGDFQLSPTEQAGQGLLSKYVAGGRPGIFDAGTSALNDLLTGNKYDPNNPTGEYKAFADQNAYNLKNAQRDTKRSLAYTGDLYSTDSGRQMKDLQVQSQLGLQSKLAELSDKYVARKLNAIPLAGTMAGQQQALDLMPITAAATYGGGQRTLNTAEDQAKMSEWIRARQEKAGRLDALKAVAGSNSNFGVGSATATAPNPLGDAFGNLGAAGIQELIQNYFAKGGGGGGGTFFGPSSPNEMYFS